MNSIFSVIPPLFVTAFFLNFFWEVWHSQFYTTCLKMPLPKLIRLLTWQSLKDAFWISLGYTLIALLFNEIDIIHDMRALGAFLILAFVFAFSVEYHAIRKGRWEYAKTMPTLFGVGLTPLFELAVTGLFAFSIVLILYYGA
jgi:hypothetical protein